METVIRTDLEHLHVLEVVEQSDGRLRSRCLVCGESLPVRWTTATYDPFGTRTNGPGKP